MFCDVLLTSTKETMLLNNLKCDHAVKLCKIPFLRDTPPLYFSTHWVIITVKGIVAVDGDDDTFWGERFLSRGSGSGWLGRAQCVCVLCCGCEGMWSLFASSVELP